MSEHSAMPDTNGIPPDAPNASAAEPNTPDSTGSEQSDNDTEPSPLAFAHATGYVFQGAGTVLMLAGGFFWVLSGFVIDSVDEAPRRWTEYLTGDRLAPALAAIGIVASVVGGLAVATAGIGLHQDRPSSGRFALAVTALLSTTYWTVGLLLLITCGAWAAGTVAVVMALCSSVMFLLAGQSASLQRRFPPPAHNAITSQELEELRKSSRH